MGIQSTLTAFCWPGFRFGRVVPDWRAKFRAAVRDRPVEEVLKTHHRADTLTGHFNFGAYLCANPDVFDAVSSAGEAVFHYLSHGHDEARMAEPCEWDAGFVRQYHGIRLPDGLTAVQANAALIRAGVPLTDALLTEVHLWLSLGLHGPVFAKIFEPEYYAAMAGLKPGCADRIGAIRHFCSVGLGKGIPPHPRHRFDASFYRDAAACSGLDVPVDDRALIRHWARVGVRAGAHANARASFEMATGLVLPDSVLTAFQSRGAAKLSQRLLRFSADPLACAGLLDPSAAGVMDLMTGLAKRLRDTGHPDTAERVLNWILRHEPSNPRARVDLADVIFPQNDIKREIALREPVPPDFDSGANRVTLAERYLATGQIGKALSALETAPTALFSDVTLCDRYRTIARAAFEHIWSNLSHWTDQTPLEQVQSHLARALALYTPRFDSPARMAPIRRVAVLTSDDLYQCKFYRADQKLEQLRHAGLQADLYLQAIDLGRLRARLDQYDALICVRLPGVPDVIDLIAAAAQQGLTCFYDADDLIFDASVFPPPLATYSGQITAQDHAAMACGVPLFRHAMGLCDYGLASTPAIRDAMAAHVRTGRAFLHRNGLGRDHLRAIQSDGARPENEKTVLFYGSGTKAHKAEFHDILEPALAQVLRDRQGQVEIRLMGHFQDLRHLDPSHPDLHLIPPVWDFALYLEALARADINLSVLSPTPVTDAKSEIKWMEAAMFSIPSVVTPTRTYSEIIRDGENGFLRVDKEGVAEVLLTLIDQTEVRESVGQAARAKVMADYDLPAMAHNLSRVFETARPVRQPRKPRLLIVNVFYPPQDIGGATRVVRDNVRDLLAGYGDQYEIDVICTLEGGQTPYEVQCHAQGGARIWAITAKPGIGVMEVQDNRMAEVFDRLLERIAPDLVHFHCLQRLTASVVGAAQRQGIPYLVTLHDGWWVSPHQFIISDTGVPETYDFGTDTLRLPDRARLTKKALDGAAVCLAVSEPFAQLHRNAGVDRVETIENGVSPLPEIRRRPGPAGRVRLGLIGGTSRHKGFHLLRAANFARRYQNLDLLIVDHALPPGRSRREVWNGTPVTLVPRCRQECVGEVYGKIDVLLAPSTWPESYGLVAREAVALGLWVIASDQGAIGQDVVEGENGHIVPVVGHGPLAECLASIDAAPETYRRPPCHGRTLRQSREQAAELHDVYQRILQARSEQEI